MSEYDIVPYIGGVFEDTHPDSMRALATLFGLNPPEARTARVLELGCSHGANLLPLALGLPDAEFVGVDYSEVQIGMGQANIQAAGATNITLRHASITDIDASWGLFDYIICHGVYSWVAPEVQAAILRVSRDNLTPDGVAYCSYNVLPGWYQRLPIRDLMLSHTRNFDEPQTRINQARAILEFLSDRDVDSNQPFSVLARAINESLQTHHDSYIFHEYLATHNEPVYFEEFARRADEVGLQYLAECEFPSMLASNFDDKSREILDQISGIIRTEHYMDFLRNRTFRKTLLVPSDREVDRKLSGQRMRAFYIACCFSVVGEQEWTLDDNSPMKFRGENDVGFVAANRLVKAALLHLAQEYPEPIAFEALLDAARAALEGDADPGNERADDAEFLGDNLLTCMAKGFVQIRLSPPTYTNSVGERPKGWAYARWQLDQGDMVTTLQHKKCRLAALDAALLRHMDGTLDREALVDVAEAAIERGEVDVRWEGPEVTDPEQRRGVIRAATLQHLAHLARLALVVP